MASTSAETRRPSHWAVDPRAARRCLGVTKSRESYPTSCWIVCVGFGCWCERRMEWTLEGKREMMSDRAREILVLAFVAVSALAFVYPIDWQDVSRLGLTQSVAIRGSLRIDPYASQTGDKALYAGHYYSDKAPGLSFAALPAFEGVRELGGVGRAERQNGVWNRLGLLWL